MTSSRQGALVCVNETEVALFRVRERVYAIKEKCPHAGAYCDGDGITLMGQPCVIRAREMVLPSPACRDQ